MPEWLWALIIGGVVLGLIAVIFGLLMQRLSRIEALAETTAANALTRTEHERLCSERADRIEKSFARYDFDRREMHAANQTMLSRIESKIDSNEALAIDRRHKLYSRMDEVCQRLAMLEAVPGDPRLRASRNED